MATISVAMNGLNESGQLTLNAQGAASNIALGTNINGTTGVTLTAGGTITQSAGTVSGGVLQVGYGGAAAVTLATNVASVNAVNAVGALTINEANGIAVSASGTTSNLTVNSGLSTAGLLSTIGAISLTNLTLNAQGSGSDIALGHNISGSTAVNLTAADTITQSAGTIGGGALTVNFVNGPVVLRNQRCIDCIDWCRRFIDHQ